MSRTRSLLLGGCCLAFVYASCAEQEARKSSETPPPETTLENWAIEVFAQRAPDTLVVYLCPKDSEKSGSIIEVPKSPYIDGLSSIVLVGQGKEPAIGFVRGKLSSPGNRLVLMDVEMQNTEEETLSFRVGDVRLATADRQKLPHAAVARGESYLVAKSTEAASSSSMQALAPVAPNEKLAMSYCFIIPPDSFPVHLKFGEQPIDTILAYDELPELERESAGMMMEMAGQLSLPESLDSLEVDASLSGHRSDIRFRAKGIYFPKDEFPEGAPLAMRISGSGARWISTRDIGAKWFGKEWQSTQSGCCLFGGRFYLAGAIEILENISAFEVTSPLGEIALETTFTCTFQAEKGDVLPGVGEVSGSFILSTVTID